jgi:NADH-quinone oxidoreductase subunit J
MSGEMILFFLLALTAIGSAAGMLISRNAVYAALYLVLNFSTVAIFYLILGSPFIALSQVTVYGGAIMVLFLFVIMLLGVEQIPTEFKWKTFLPADAAPSALASKLFTVYLLPFEITSILLLVAMVGAIVLTKQSPAGKKGAQG